MTNGTINITLSSPELVEALKQLAAAITGKPEAPTTPALPAAPGATDKPLAEDLPTATYEEVHAALVKLKQQKSAAQVREILNEVGCKTVQDIPPEKFAFVRQLAAEKLAA